MATTPIHELPYPGGDDVAGLGRTNLADLALAVEQVIEARRQEDIATYLAQDDAADGYLGLDAHLRNPLAIWAEFDTANVYGESWLAQTYPDWITGIDALFATEIGAGTVVKTDGGLCSDGVNNMYSYRFGPAVGRRVLLVAGQHGEEVLSQHAAMRFFQGFVQSNHPTMRYLRSRIQIEWVPTANPYGYRAYPGSPNEPGRLNANDVDPNRNYPFLWTPFVPADDALGATLAAKGSAALSEPETDFIRDLIDARSSSCVIDCHNFGSSPANELQIVPPTNHIVVGSRRDLASRALRTWLGVYTPAATYSVAQPNQGKPLLGNWAGYYARHVAGRLDGAAITVEASSTLEGSVGGSARHRTTQAALRLYCGFISTYLLTWLEAT
ncbi:M14 family metallopeptidase [Euzebya rosea]|uniref:M14 family metallopeptidase n=1 Tax=Euzebya rosea TaxID=2052804 RepID=UPI000D3E0972|nr:M14 family metallopeptidase [Euzebya rosea]